MDDEARKRIQDNVKVEEDDDFEEFEAEDWTAQQEDPKNIALWERDWDNDSLQDQFAEELKAQLAAEQQ